MNLRTYQNLSISLGNMKILKFSRSNQKSGTPKMLIITYVFEEKTMLRLQDKNQSVPECLCLLAFLKDVDDNNGRREMAHFLIWVWRLPQQHFDHQAMRDYHDVLSILHFPCSHSNIMNIDDLRMWILARTCDKNEGRQREGKPAHHN